IIVEKDLEKANEKWKKKVRVFLGENEGDFDENKREEFVPPQVSTFDTAPGQVVEEVLIWKCSRKKEKEGTRLKRLRNSQCMPRNPMKGLALYLPQWNETRVYDPGGKQRVIYQDLRVLNIDDVKQINIRSLWNSPLNG
ncbi:8240_t:CDS:2, partial [Racocetra persica]